MLDYALKMMVCGYTTRIFEQWRGRHFLLTLNFYNMVVLKTKGLNKGVFAKSLKNLWVGGLLNSSVAYLRTYHFNDGPSCWLKTVI